MLWDGKKVRSISAYPYARRYQAPTSVSFFSYDGTQLQFPQSSKFYDRNGKFPRSEELEARIKKQWGTIHYTNARELLHEKKFIGVIKQEGLAAASLIEELIDTMFQVKGGIDEITVAANSEGYKVIVKRERRVVNIEYNASTDTVIAYHYIPTKNVPSCARARMHALIGAEPKPDKYATTNDIGVYVYGTENIVVSVVSKRGKRTTYNKPNKRVATMSGAEEFIRQEFAYNLPATFATAEEMKRIEKGEHIQFTLQLRGYRYGDAENKERDALLRKAYVAGICTGIKGIVRTLGRVYSQTQREQEKDPERMTQDEWFREVYMKAEALPMSFVDDRGMRRQVPVREIIIDKDHPMYRMIAQRVLGRKPKQEEVIVLRETKVSPTFEGLQERGEAYLAEKAEEEARHQKENARQWREEDSSAAQRMVGR